VTYEYTSCSKFQ